MKAVSHAEKRFPYFRVQLKEGFFWYYLEHLPSHFHVEPDNKRPCRYFPHNSLMLRILVRNNKISVEFSHILTDGGGALNFLTTLLEYYADELKKEPADISESISEPDIGEEEYEDSYKRYFKEHIPPMVSRSKAYHLPFALNSRPRFRSRNYIVSMPAIKEAAVAHKVSITDFLVGIYVCSLQEIYENRKLRGNKSRDKRMRVQVPVNLRKIFSSKTMRNFSLFVMPEIDLRLGHYSFEEILKAVYHQIRLETDEKLINKNISRNVGSEKKIYVKSIPLFLKSLILRLNYYTKGTNQYSGVITNLGKAKMPGSVTGLVDYMIFSPPPPNKILKVGCGGIGFGDKLVLSFGNISKSTLLEDIFIHLLNQQDIEVKPENNKPTTT